MKRLLKYKRPWLDVKILYFCIWYAMKVKMMRLLSLGNKEHEGIFNRFVQQNQAYAYKFNHNHTVIPTEFRKKEEKNFEFI